MERTCGKWNEPGTNETQKQKKMKRKRKRPNISKNLYLKLFEKVKYKFYISVKLQKRKIALQ